MLFVGGRLTSKCVRIRFIRHMIWYVRVEFPWKLHAKEKKPLMMESNYSVWRIFLRRNHKIKFVFFPFFDKIQIVRTYSFSVSGGKL